MIANDIFIVFTVFYDLTNLFYFYYFFFFFQIEVFQIKFPRFL